MFFRNKTSLYFAYGSNLLIERLEKRVQKYGPVKKVQTFTLNNYKLVFNVKGGFANIEPCDGEVVEGVLYELNERQLEVLDWYEGYYKRIYFRQGNITFISYIAYDFYTYYAIIPPSLEYLNIIIDGAMTNKLKNTYNKMVIFKNQLFKLKKSKHRLWK